MEVFFVTSDTICVSMKTNKHKKLWIVIVLVFIAVGAGVYYLLVVQKVLSPIEDRYAHKQPSINFLDIVSYTSAGDNKEYIINAPTEAEYTGTCTFVFTKGTHKRLESTSNIENKYGCYFTQPFAFFGSEGLWDAFILLRSRDGKFATKTLEHVDINANYKPEERSFTSVDTTYTKDANGNGIHSFKVHMSDKATGSCYFFFFPERGKAIGEFGVVSKEIAVNDTNTCSIEVSSTEFKAKGWWSYSVSFNEPYNRFHFETYEGRHFIYY